MSVISLSRLFAPLTALALLLALCSPATAAPFVVCHYGQPASGCVVDGDTFWLAGEKIRPSGFDAPEMGKPKCSGPAPLAKASRAQLLELLNRGRVSISREGHDKYGRTLATVTAGGRDVGAVLISEGLARRYVPGQRPWCN